MANPDAAFGLKPVRHLMGIPWNGQTERALVEDDTSGNLFIGDPVLITGALGVDDATGHFNVVDIATEGDGNRIWGVITSIDPIRTDLEKVYMPATTGGYVNVCVDPYVIFAVQDDAAATLTSASVGANAILDAGAGGSTITGLSSWELKADTTPAADASYQLTIVGVHNRVDQAVGANVIWEVLITNHLLTGGGVATDEGVLGI